MNERLLRAFNHLEVQRTELLDELRDVPEEKLNQAPPHKWSVIRILSHLITGERTGLEYVRKKMLGIDNAADSGLYEELKMRILELSQRIPFLKYKAPRVIEERTIVYKDLSEVEREWVALRGEWKGLLESIPEDRVNRKIFRHVVAGRLNIEQGIRFFWEHVNHHRPQIRERL